MVSLIKDFIISFNLFMGRKEALVMKTKSDELIPKFFLKFFPFLLNLFRSTPLCIISFGIFFLTVINLLIANLENLD